MLEDESELRIFRTIPVTQDVDERVMPDASIDDNFLLGCKKVGVVNSRELAYHILTVALPRRCPEQCYRHSSVKWLYDRILRRCQGYVARAK